MLNHRNILTLLTVFLLLGLSFTTCTEAQDISKSEQKKTSLAKSISRKKLETWIDQLSEGSFRERRTASNNLLNAGKPSIPFLVKGTQMKDAELSNRCFGIIVAMYRGKHKNLSSAAEKTLSEFEKSPNKSLALRAKKTFLVTSIGAIKLLGGTVTLDDSGKVRYVNFRDTKVTASDLVHLKRFTNLTGLILDSTAVTDAGLVHLKGLSKLEWIYLSRTKITDVGLAHLKTLKNLQKLKIQFSKVTYAGINDFKSAVPKCGVIW